MAIRSLGKVTVASAGTPVQATATSRQVCAIVIVPLASNTGLVYPGQSTLVKATLVGAFHDGLAAGQVYTLGPGTGGNTLDPSLLYLDADVNGEGAVIYTDEV